MTHSPAASPGDPASAPEPPAKSGSRLHAIFFGPRELRAGWRLLVFLALLGIMGTGVYFLQRASGPAPPGASNSAAGIFFGESVVFFLLLIATFIMAKLEGRSLADYGLPWRSAFHGKFWEGTVWGFALLTAVLLLLRATGHAAFGGVELHGRTLVEYGLGWALAYLVAGFFEEMLLRGYPQFTLTTGIGFWPAAVVLSVTFGCMHWSNPGENPQGLFVAGLIGFIFCLTLRRTGDLWFAIGCHAAFDWGLTFFYGVPNSGIVAAGHFLSVTTAGPAWLTGGADGPEGSLFTILLLGVFWVALSRRFPAARYPTPAALEPRRFRAEPS